MNDFDQMSRVAARIDGAGFVRWLLGPAAAVSFAGWFDTRTLPADFPRDRTADTVARLTPDAGGPAVLLVTDFQTENDAEILERLGEYAVRFRRELRREGVMVVVAVVNLTGPGQDDTLEMAVPGLPAYGVRVRAVVRTLREEDAGATVADVAAGAVARCVLAWVPLMRGAGEVGTIEAWLQAVQAEADPNRRDQYVAIALTFAELTDHRDAWVRALEDWNVRKSAFLEEIRGEGRVEETRKRLRQVLARFNGDLPRELDAAIEAADLAVLDIWFTAALSADSLPAFRAAVNR